MRFIRFFGNFGAFALSLLSATEGRREAAPLLRSVALLRRLRRIKKSPLLPAHPPLRIANSGRSPCLLRGARSCRFAPSPRLSPSLCFTCLGFYRRASSLRCGVSPWSLRSCGASPCFGDFGELKNLRFFPPSPPLRIANSGRLPCLLRGARSCRFAPSSRLSPSLRFACLGFYRRASSLRCGVSPPARSLLVLATLRTCGVSSPFHAVHATNTLKQRSSYKAPMFCWSEPTCGGRPSVAPPNLFPCFSYESPMFYWSEPTCVVATFGRPPESISPSLLRRSYVLLERTNLWGRPKVTPTNIPMQKLCFCIGENSILSKLLPFSG